MKAVSIGMRAPRARAAMVMGVVIAAAQMFAAPPVSAATTYAGDAFSRTASGSWGNADTGGSWYISSPTSAFSVSNGRGRVSVGAAGAMRSALLAAQARDVDVSVRASTDKTATGFGQFVYLVVRRDTSGHEYRMGVRLSGSAVYLQVVRMSGSSGALVGSEVRATNVSYSAGQTLRIRARASGANPTTLQMKVWGDTAPEPSSWTYSATDSTASLQVSGSFAIRSYLGSNTTNAPVSFSYDDYLVTSIDTTATLPPPGKFVSTTGSDSNDGSYSRPWRTLQHAANVATGQVNIRGGTYAGFTLKRSGLTFVNYPGETATVSGGVDVVNIYRVTSATIRGLTIKNAAGPRGAGILVVESSNVVIDANLLRDNKSYGIETWNSTYVTIKNNEVTSNDVGIRIEYRATGTQILDNRIHHNDTMIDPTRKDVGGGVGIEFYKSTGAVLAKGNRVWGHRAPDNFHVYDGAGFEIFGASDLTITQNVIWDNKHVMETGTADGYACNNNKFTRNVAYGASTVPGYAYGLLFACMSNSMVANNTLRGFDIAAVAVVYKSTYMFQGSLDGLTLRNNILVSDGPAVYYFDNVPSTVSIDRDYLWNRAGGALAYVVGKGSVSTLSALRTVTGVEKNGFVGDPQFVSLSSHDYRLQTTSPAIDKGWTVSGVTDGYLGTAPDIGRYETR